MVEVEVKYAAADTAALEQKLAALGARPRPPREEVDHYFNAPDRDFARTDEALRLRQRDGEHNAVTYKGPKRDASTKSRTELELELPAGPEQPAAWAELLGHLGYRPVAVVRKKRVVYDLTSSGFDAEVCLDDVAGVGRFVEVEIAAPEEKYDAARQAVLQLAKVLGLSNPERRSYLELLLECTARGEPKE